MKKKLCVIQSFVSLPPLKDGVVAQLVEQRTENPCVTGSIPVDATLKAPEFGAFFEGHISKKAEYIILSFLFSNKKGHPQYQEWPNKKIAYYSSKTS